MVKNKILPNNPKFQRIRKRYFSVNLGRGPLNNIIASKKKGIIERRSMIANPEIIKKDENNNVEEDQKIEDLKEFKKQHKNKDNDSKKSEVIKIKINDNYNLKNKISEHFNTLNKDIEENYNNINTKRISSRFIKKTCEGSINSKNNDNKIIFKYVAQNVENESNYGNISMIKDDVKKYQQSFNSKIFDENDNCSNNLSSSNEMNIKEDEKKNDIESNLEEKIITKLLSQKNIKIFH